MEGECNALLPRTQANNPQVITVLNELGVPYNIHSFKFDDVKKPPFININPNGRVPG